MEMPFRSVRPSLSVVIRFVVELFRKHIFDSWFSDCLQRVEGVAGGSIGWAKAQVAPSLPFSPPPEETPRAKCNTTRKYEQCVERKIAAQEIQ